MKVKFKQWWVNNFTNINKTNNHLSLSQRTPKKKTTACHVGNPCPGLGHVRLIKNVMSRQVNKPYLRTFLSDISYTTPYCFVRRCDAGYALYIYYHLDNLWASGGNNMVVKWYTFILRGKVVTIIGLLSDRDLYCKGKWWKNMVVKWYTFILWGKVETTIGELSDTYLYYEWKW